MKKIIAALMVLFMMGTAMAGDTGTTSPTGEIDTTIVTTYPSNSWTQSETIGDATGMDQYRYYNEDFCWTHTYTPTAGTYIMSVDLTIRAWDIDDDVIDPEVDIIYVDGMNVGVLVGNNNEWSETTFSVPVSALDDNTMEVCIDIDSTHSSLAWAVTVDWSRMDVEYDTAVSTPEPALAIGLLSILVPGMIYLVRKRE